MGTNVFVFMASYTVSSSLVNNQDNTKVDWRGCACWLMKKINMCGPRSMIITLQGGSLFS